MAFDDWTITEKIADEEHLELRQTWQNPSFGTIEKYKRFVAGAGFEITKIEDVSNVGRELMPRHFEPVFERDFRPKIENLFPEYGKKMADDLKKDILFTIRLYLEGKFGYYRLIAKSI